MQSSLDEWKLIQYLHRRLRLRLPNTEILALLESDEKLKHKIDEAVKILEQKK